MSERDQVLAIANSNKFCDLPPCQIVPRLADEDQFIASESTFYRILRSENQLKHRGRSRPKKSAKPKSLLARGPNQVWCWDISYLSSPIRGLFYYLYFIIDIYSRKIVGYSVESCESSELASELFKKIVSSENVTPRTLNLHSDNGAPMKGATLVETLKALGVMRSYSRPRVSDDNPFVESLFRTTKYCSEYPDFFKSLEHAKSWVEEFVDWYNTKHYHSGLNFVTPEQSHNGLAKVVLNKRRMVYEKARLKNPQRWSSNCRVWELPEVVELNPGKEVRIAA